MLKSSILIILSLLIISNTFDIKNIQHQINIQNVDQYAQYIKLLNGLATQKDLQNQQLNQILTNQRISLLNSVQNIVLVLVDQIDNQQNTQLSQDINTLNNLNQLLNTFDILNLADLDSQTLNKKIQQLKQNGNFIHTLQVSSQIAQQFNNHNTRKLLEDYQSVQSHGNEQQSSTHDQVYEQAENIIHEKKSKPVKAVSEVKFNHSYILKFFFAFIFIIVSLGSLMMIANMQNKKDTLLYAKFIADVNTR